MSVSTFAITNTAVTRVGAVGSASIDATTVQTADEQLGSFRAFRAVGTQCRLHCRFWATGIEVWVDGVQKTIDSGEITAVGSAINYITLFTGASDAGHDVIIICTSDSSPWIDTAAGIEVTGASPALQRYTGMGASPKRLTTFHTDVRMEGLWTFISNGGWTTHAYANPTAGMKCNSLRLACQDSTLWLFGAGSSMVVRLWTDGVAGSWQTINRYSPGSAKTYGLYQIATGLDTASAHTYRVQLQASGEIIALLTGTGTSASTLASATITPQAAVVSYGDSITDGTGLSDQGNQYGTLVSTSLGLPHAQNGRGFTRMMQSPGVNDPFGGELWDDLCGEATVRQDEVFNNLEVEPAYVLEMFGANDMGDGTTDPTTGRAEDLATFQASCQNCYTKILARTTATVIYAFGPLPRTDVSDAITGAWRSAKQAAVSAMASVRVKYVDVSSVTKNTIHPADVTHQEVQTLVLAAIGPSSFTTPAPYRPRRQFRNRALTRM